MEASEVFESTTYASPSPNSHYIASLDSTHLSIYYTLGLNLAASFPLDSTTPTTRSASDPQITWTSDSLHILLISGTGISLFSLDDTSAHVRIANGSGGLGRVVTAEKFGSQILVIWEFGRVGLCDVSRGRVTEIGELKTGLGSLRGAWCVRRSKENKPEVLALLSRTTAQDILSLYLPTSTTPFISTTLPTSDTQTILWSPCGNWLSILDTPLSSPGSSLHVYTADGNHFRSWPQPNSSSFSEALLGPQRQVWGLKYLGLGFHDGTVTLLDTRTFSRETLLLEAVPETSCYTETTSSKGGDHSWKFSRSGTTNSTPTSSQVTDLRFDSGGTFLALKHEITSDTVTIYNLETPVDETSKTIQKQEKPPHIILKSCTPIKNLLWHPRTPGLLVIITETNTISFYDTFSEHAPTHIPTSSFPVSGSSIPVPFSAHWLTQTKSSALLVSTKKRGWIILFPFGKTTEAEEIEARKEEEQALDDSQDSLFEILSGRTPLPGLSLRDRDDERGDEEDDDGLEDTFRGKSSIGTVY